MQIESVQSYFFEWIVKSWAALLRLCNRFSTYFQWLIGRCSLVFGASIMQDRDLSVYSPSESRTSKPLSCSHDLCANRPNCKSPDQPCPYTVNYFSENTSSSGMLVEDTLYLMSNDTHASSGTVQTPVIIGYALFVSCSNVRFQLANCTIFFTKFVSGCALNFLSIFFNVAVVESKLVVIWMELLLMAFLV